MEILHAHVVPQPAPRGKFRASLTPPSEEDMERALKDSKALFDEAQEILRAGVVKEVIGTHIEAFFWAVF